MKKKISSLFFSLILFSSIFYFITSVTVTAHEDKKINHRKHKPIFCVLEEDRTGPQKWWCKTQMRVHRLCKIEEHCAIVKIAELQKIIDELEAKIIKQDPVKCNSLNFGHVGLKDGNVYQSTSDTSKVIKKIKKGQKISYIGISDKKGWLIVVPKDKICTVGYIHENYIGLSTASGSSEDVNSGGNEMPKGTNIKITYPKWKTKNKLIVLDQSGFFEIDGFVNKELGINKVIINYDGNDEEMILGSDGSFNASLQIENTLDVRITSYKGKKQIGKVLTFKIEVE